MAEQRPWFKLWVSALSDDALEALSLEDWARWARLGAHVKLHGERGSILSRHPHDGLARVFRHSRQGGSTGGREGMSSRVLATLRRLPNVVVEEVSNGQGPGIRVTFTNWKKYQEDSSADRTRDWRQKKKERDGQAPSQPPPRCDGIPPSRGDDVEERRRESPYPPTSPAVTPTSRPSHPPEAFNHDCAWPGRCVNAEYFDAHPDAGLPVRGKDDQQRIRPKQCPTHREQDEQPW